LNQRTGRSDDLLEGLRQTYALCSIAVSFRVTLVVDIVRGVRPFTTKSVVS
jgi:acetamidase/formamidase